MDIVDKFYCICELFNDDLYQVSLHIKRSGAKGRPSKILKNISNLLLDRYADIITNTYNQKGEYERTTNQ